VKVKESRRGFFSSTKRRERREREIKININKYHAVFSLFFNLDLSLSF